MSLFGNDKADIELTITRIEGVLGSFSSASATLAADVALYVDPDSPSTLTSVALIRNDRPVVIVLVDFEPMLKTELGIRASRADAAEEDVLAQHAMLRHLIALRLAVIDTLLRRDEGLKLERTTLPDLGICITVRGAADNQVLLGVPIESTPGAGQP